MWWPWPGSGPFSPHRLLVYPGRVLNTHPALLPAFKGCHAVRDALAAGVKVTGCTVHVATDEVDEGPILAQEAVQVEPSDTGRRSTSGSRRSNGGCIPRRSDAFSKEGAA